MKLRGWLHECQVLITGVGEPGVLWDPALRSGPTWGPGDKREKHGYQPGRTHRLVRETEETKV